MSNYPPGVTGNEPAIAGLAEGNAKNLECAASTDGEFTVTDEAGKGWTVNASYECPWEGDVDAQYGGTKGCPIRYWTCPLCGHEHEDELSDD